MKLKYYLVISLIFLLTIVGTIFLNDDLGFEYNNVELTEKEYNSIQEELPNQLVKVCNLENKNCIVMIPIK